MIDHRAIHRYARALFELALDRGELETIDRHFIRVRELVNQHREISHLVSNSTISLAEKEDFIGKIVPSDLPVTLLNFLKVLIKKKRFNELVFIQADFHKLAEKKQGIREVEAVTAAALSERTENKLREALKRKLRSEIRLITKVDPDLIGGFILRFDDSEINSSFRGRIEEIRQSLI